MIKEPVVRSLTVRNLLSFGEEPTTIELRNLNVLIGANGSGKSNLIEVLGLLQNAPKELATAISNGGSIDEWLWKGATQSKRSATASIEAIISSSNGKMPLRYRLAFTKGAGYRFEITDERLENELSSPREQRPYFYYGLENGRPLNYKGEKRGLRQEEINPQLSILAQQRIRNTIPKSPMLVTYLQDSGSTATGSSAPSPTSGSLVMRVYPTNTSRKMDQILALFSTGSSLCHP